MESLIKRQNTLNTPLLSQEEKMKQLSKSVKIQH